MQAAKEKPAPIFAEPGRSIALKAGIEFIDRLAKVLEKHAGMTTAQAAKFLSSQSSDETKADTGPHVVHTMSQVEDRRTILAGTLGMLSKRRGDLEHQLARTVEPEVPVEGLMVHQQFLNFFRGQVRVQTDNRLSAVSQFCSRQEWSQARRWALDASSLPLVIWKDEQARRLR